MNKFKISFRGRELNAIGEFSDLSIEVSTPTLLWAMITQSWLSILPDMNATTSTTLKKYESYARKYTIHPAFVREMQEEATSEDEEWVTVASGKTEREPVKQSKRVKRLTRRKNYGTCLSTISPYRS